MSLQIAHRLSFDFDLFLERPLKKEDLLRIKKTFKIAGVQINTSEQLTVKQNFVDIFELIKLGERKFGVEFNPKLFLEQLIYFEDIKISKISFIKEKPSVLEIQHFLKQQVRVFREKELKS